MTHRGEEEKLMEKISRKAKVLVYQTIILQSVTFATGVWGVNKNYEQKCGR